MNEIDANFRENKAVASPCQCCRTPFFHGQYSDASARSVCGQEGCKAKLSFGITDATNPQMQQRLADKYRDDETTALPGQSPEVFGSCEFECAQCSPDVAVAKAALGGCYRDVMEHVGNLAGQDISWATGGAISTSFILESAFSMVGQKPASTDPTPQE